MSYYSEKKKAKSAFIAESAMHETSKDDVRLVRALAVLHAMDCLIRTDQKTILKEIIATDSNAALSRNTKKALPQNIFDALTKPKRNNAGTGSVLEGVQGLINDTLSEDQDGKFKLDTSKYQAAFISAVNAKPEALNGIKKGLDTLKELDPDDFRRLRQSMSMNTDKIKPASRAALGAFNLAVPHGMIEPAEQLLIIGYTPDTNEYRL